MNPILPTIIVSAISILFFGMVAWGIQRWVSKVGDKIDQILRDIHDLKLKDAKNDGSNGTRFALVETEVRHMAERVARLEGSSKRLWSKVEPEPETGRG